MTEHPQHTDPTDNSIGNNLARVREQIAEACHRYGRDVGDVRLIAVSKTKPAAAVRTAIEAGHVDFGENQMQDALSKIPQFENSKLSWHYIGPLQSNKSKFIAGNFNWWHTMTRLDVAQRVSRKAVDVGKPVNVLIQINITNDPAKSGITSNELAPLIEQLLKSDLAGIKLRGLMTIGPQGANEAELRKCFAKLNALLQENQKRFGLASFDQLSMGMTGDLVPAIAEGATMVRVGSAIFGSR
ncbi:MAG: YggS family pyridoxal phosphate-dependent enzyme [Acidiferrobacterales bacterium]